MNQAVDKIAVNAIRLQQAVLCANCDCISDSPHDACLVCGSRSLLPLARVLNRTGAAVRIVKSPEQKPMLDNVLVLASPPHRHRHRSRR